jgi:hypothetical protein
MQRKVFEHLETTMPTKWTRKLRASVPDDERYNNGIDRKFVQGGGVTMARSGLEFHRRGSQRGRFGTSLG